MIEINTEPMSTSSGNCGSHVSTDWQFATDANFTNIIHESLEDTVNLNNYVFDNNAEYYPVLFARARYRTTNCLTNWSVITLNEESITQSKIATPSVSYDVDNNKVIASDFMLLSDTLDRHIATDWEIKNINNVPVFQSLNDTVNLNEIELPPGLLDPNESYAFTVVYRGYHNKSLIGGTIAPVDHTTPIPDPTIRIPEVTVQGELNNVSETPILTSTPFSMVQGNDTHQSTDWQVYMHLNGIETLVWEDLGATGGQLTTNQIPPGIIYNGPEWIFKIRHNGVFSISDWGTKTIYSINQPLILVKPTLSLNWIYNYKVPTNPVLYTTEFKVLNGTDTHASTTWRAEIKMGNNWVLQWESISNTIDKLGIQLPNNELPFNTEVRFQATHESGSGLTNTSDWVYGTTVENDYSGFRQLTNPPIDIYNGSGSLGSNNDVIIVPGSDNGDNFISSSLSYDPENDTWETINNITINSLRPLTTIVNENIYKIGGVLNDVSETPVLDIEVLNTAIVNGSWSAVTQLPSLMKQFGCSVLNNNMLFVTGGWANDNVYQISRKTWLYDILSNQWSQHVDLPDWLKGHCQLTLNNGEVLLIGGMTDNNVNYLSKVYVMTTDSIWSIDSFLPEALREVKAVVMLDGRVIITTARRSDGSFIDRFLIRDPITKDWSYGEVFPVNYPTNHVSVALKDNTFVILGGNGDSFRYYT